MDWLPDAPRRYLNWWAHLDSNQDSTNYEFAALTIKLWALFLFYHTFAMKCAMTYSKVPRPTNKNAMIAIIAFSSVVISYLTIYLNLVDGLGIEPRTLFGDRFTVCRDQPIVTFHPNIYLL